MGQYIYNIKDHVSPVGRISGRTIAVKPVLPAVTGIGSGHRKSTKVLTNLDPVRNVDSVQGSISTQQCQHFILPNPKP